MVRSAPAGVPPTASVTGIIRALLPVTPADRMIDWVRLVSSLDRYQASEGLSRAAGLIAEVAVDVGLEDVSVQSFPADGAPRWWTFEAPMSWTPSVARLSVTRAGVPLLRLDHARDPFAVATYSASTPAGGVSVPVVPFAGTSPAAFAGALVVVRRSDLSSAPVVGELTSAGAVGYVTDAVTKGDGGRYRGRIELPLHSPLLAFSLTTAEMETVDRALRDGSGRLLAHVEVDCRSDAQMPSVSGVLPGDGAEDEEVWLTAHLCHPRPSANDNASGVAALLGVASTLAARRRRDPSWITRRTIRFLWGPEFVGTAAVLHRRVTGSGGQALPHVLVNLDMVGEDQRRCRSPFVVERPPDYLGSFLGPLAEHVVEQVFAMTSDHGGSWAPSPFLGFSDHALVADPSIARPAVQLCHPADQFNHSAGDTVDNVSAAEMRRSAVVAATLAVLTAGTDLARLDRLTIAQTWAAREAAVAEAIAAREGGRWGRGLLEYVDSRITAVSRTLAYRPVTAQPASSRGALRRNWDGPLNLRAMTAELSPPERRDLDALVAGDKGVLSLLYHCAIRADGCRGDAQIIDETSYELRRPVSDRLGMILLDFLRASGWVVAD